MFGTRKVEVWLVTLVTHDQKKKNIKFIVRTTFYFFLDQSLVNHDGYIQSQPILSI